MTRISFNPPKRRWPVVLTSLIAAVLVAALAWPTSRHELVKVVVPQQSVAPAAVAIQTAPLATSLPPLAPAASRPAAVVLTKAQEFDRLAQSRDPADYLAAYKMAWRCKWDGCSDLSPGQVTTGFNLLQQAVAAHVPGAANHLFDFGPDGRDIGEVWDDPVYAAWKQSVMDEITAAAHRGDVKALRYMAELARMDNKPEKALTYWTAYADKVANDALIAPHMGGYLTGLTPEQIASATAAGHAMARGQK